MRLFFTRPFTRQSTIRSLTTTPFYGAPRPEPSPLALAVSSAMAAFLDPTRAEQVAALGELTGHVALQKMYHTMMADPVGQWILQDKPLVVGMPPSNTKKETFGYAYQEFLQQHEFDPNDRAPIQYIQDPNLAYVMLRYRQCHDFWHVLTGLPPTVLGELGLKWLEVLQTGLPVAALSVTVGRFKLNDEERNILHQHYLPWAIQMSQQSKYLLNVYYEKEWDTNLIELRKRLNIEVAPLAVISEGEKHL